MFVYAPRVFQKTKETLKTLTDLDETINEKYVKGMTDGFDVQRLDFKCSCCTEGSCFDKPTPTVHPLFKLKWIHFRG